jgi:hypothetical protein
MSMATTMGSSATSLSGLLSERASREEIAAFLDGLSGRERVAQALSLRGAEVKRLYQATLGGRELTPDDFVPVEQGEDSTVIFEGRNSLPSFSRFQKRFARMGDEVVGYNHQLIPMLSTAIGPGFFVVVPANDHSDAPGELYFDYGLEPENIPSGWPRFRPNTAGISYAVDSHMKDYMREAGRKVYVGKAYRNGKSRNQYFLLTRGD